VDSDVKDKSAERYDTWWHVEVPFRSCKRKE